MPTQNPRLNIVLNESIAKNLDFLAKEEGKSMSALGRELIEQALELREDFLLSQFADERVKETKTYISHEDAWDI